MAKGSAALVLLGRTPDTGYAVSVGEREPGVASVRRPCTTPPDVVAAISVSGPIDRTSTDPGHRYGHQVIDAATDLETALGWR
ncbi:MAG: IclR family transcriptional regulator C-terminal domain-containing protein [Acidimicrobiales bacterium]